MKTFPLLLTVLGAAAAGAAAGILMAPRKGSETRDNIKDFIKSHYPSIKEHRLEALAEQIEKEIKEA